MAWQLVPNAGPLCSRHISELPPSAASILLQEASPGKKREVPAVFKKGKHAYRS